jgi:PAS domain S-box-containing protein
MESEERFRGYFEHSQVGMAVTAPDKGWIEVNGQLQQMLGYNLDELRQMTWDNLTHPDDLATDLKNFEQMLAGEIDDYTMDKRFIRKDGGVVYANFTVTCVRRPDGSVQNVLASMLDITERKQAEQALLESRAAARGLLDATQESLLLLDKEGTIIAVNQTAARRLQQKPAELIGTHHVDNLPENVIESRKTHFQKVLQTGNPVDFEDVRDGIVFHNIYYPLRDKDDVIMGVAIFAHDITERKRAEEALKESEINMRAIFENSPLGMIHFSKDGTILDCNDQFVELMGSSREKLIGFNTPKQTTDEKLRAAIIKALAGETAEYEGDYTSTTGNKTTSLRIVFNPTEPGTSPTEVIATLEDITERKQAEEAIRKSKERLNTILKTTAQGFWLNDEDDNLMEVNEAMCEILGLSKEKIVGSNFFDFLDEKNREVVREQNRMRKKGIRSMYEISLIRSDGQQVPCLMNASPLLDADGNVIGSFGMTTNIAERKQMEEELRKNVDELERFSKVAFGREKKMIQLKQEINELMMRLGQNEKYKIVQ